MILSKHFSPSTTAKQMVLELSPSNSMQIQRKYLEKTELLS
nr:MAG TPA: hypothetical protein [Caudoviricetes sp.]